MVISQYRTCPGCGARLPATGACPDSRYHASPECWQVYGELTAYTLTHGDAGFIHQLAVDAYAAQHAGEHTSAIGVAFALIGLYLACEQGYSGRKVQHMHMMLARRSKTWPRFVPPVHAGAVTVLDVVQASPGKERDAMLRRWGQSVWDAWSQDHEQVKTLLASVMAE